MAASRSGSLAAPQHIAQDAMHAKAGMLSVEAKSGPTLRCGGRAYGCNQKGPRHRGVLGGIEVRAVPGHGLAGHGALR